MDGLILLQEASAAGLTVLADGDRLVIRGPRSADAIARRLLAHKAAVIAALRRETSTPLVPQAPPSIASGPQVIEAAGSVNPNAPATNHPGACRRCGSDDTVDVPIHGGLSVRRDCRRCGRFIDFPVWYGRPMPKENRDQGVDYCASEPYNRTDEARYEERK